MVHVRVIVADLVINLRERGRAAQTAAAPAQIHHQEFGPLDVLEVGRDGLADIHHRGESRDDQTQRGDLTLFLPLRGLPKRTHRERVFPHRDADAQFGTQFHADGLNRVEEVGVLALFGAGGHPVGREFHLADGADVRRGDVRERLAHGHAARGRGADHGDLRAFAHRHRLARDRLEPARGDRDVRDRGLVGADHLVARHVAGDAAVGDGDEEGLVGHGGQVQNALDRLFERDLGQVERRVFFGQAFDIAEHFRRFAEDDLKFDVDRVVVEMLVVEGQVAVARGFADDGDRAALALTQTEEEVEMLRLDAQHVTLLGLAAPDFHRAHRGLFVVDLAQPELAPDLGDQLRAAI